MRVLRTTAYMSPDGGLNVDGMTVVTRDCDLRDTLESLLQSVYEPGVFVCHEIFTMSESTDILAATLAATQRIERERERDMAVLYFWDAQYLGRINSGGTLSTKDPSPLNADEIRLVLRQLALHPNYQDQTVMVHDENGLIVTMKDGIIEGDPNV